jgi:hypothetical protein
MARFSIPWSSVHRFLTDIEQQERRGIAGLPPQVLAPILIRPEELGVDLLRLY